MQYVEVRKNDVSTLLVRSLSLTWVKTPTAPKEVVEYRVYVFDTSNKVWLNNGATYGVTNEQTQLESIYSEIAIEDNQVVVTTMTTDATEKPVDINDKYLIKTIVIVANESSNSGERMFSYYPRVLQNIAEFQGIIHTEGDEIDYARAFVKSTLDNAYITTMNEERLTQWEQALGIQPLVNTSISDRRNTIIARVRGKGKLNTSLINSIVNAFIGGKATSYMRDSVLYVEIAPPPSNKQFQFLNVEQEIRNKLPAHIGLVVTRDYATWNEVTEDFATWQSVKDNFETWQDMFAYDSD